MGPLAQAAALLEQTGDCDAMAARLELHAALMIRDGQLQPAIDLLQPVLSLAETDLLPVVRFNLQTRHAIALERFGHFDEALRQHYGAVATARRTQDPAILSFALGATSGLQNSMLNLHDALRLSDECWALCGDAEWLNVIALAGPNRMMVLSGLQRHDDAVPWPSD
ncbi:MAG: hypothetical protein OEY03_06860 [Rhizobacter sp.]|nr:hypothetical protein [Rhizobacter sp.]